MKKKLKNKNFTTFPTEKEPIRVLYKKVGQAPEVKIINDIFKLKKFIVMKDLSIIPYEKLFIICNNNKLANYMRPNIFLPLKRILGDLIVVNIDKNAREFRSLSQEEIIWYSRDLINKSPKNTIKNIKKQKINIYTDTYERGFEDNRYNKPTNFEKTLISVLINLELVLASIIKNNGADKK